VSAQTKAAPISTPSPAKILTETTGSSFLAAATKPRPEERKS
jgi:hypothetical protein